MNSICAHITGADYSHDSRYESGDHVTAQVPAQVTAEVTAQVAAFCREPQPAKAIMAELGLKHWKGRR